MTVLRSCLLALFVAAGPLAGLPAAERPTTGVMVAAAANLTYVIEALNAEFRRIEPQAHLTVTLGASGNLYAQITHGAPFDVFLSADNEYPQALVAAGLAVKASVAPFAKGRLAFWTTRTDLDPSNIAATVRNDSVRKLAMAQPRTAPYGRAAQAALEKLGAWTDARAKLVIGENIAQTAQFVETGNADAGFVALSMLVEHRDRIAGRWVEVPPALFERVSLAHTSVLTSHGAANDLARRYLAFLQSPAARKILQAQGYASP